MMTREEHLKTAVLLLDEAISHLSSWEELTPIGKSRVRPNPEIRLASRMLSYLGKELLSYARG